MVNRSPFQVHHHDRPKRYLRHLKSSQALVLRSHRDEYRRLPHNENINRLTQGLGLGWFTDVGSKQPVVHALTRIISRKNEHRSALLW